MNLVKLCLLSLMILNSALGQTDQSTPTEEKKYDDYEERFGTGSSEFEYERFDNESIILSIKKDMEFACTKEGLCTLSAVTSRDNRFTAQFNFGEGYLMGGFNSGGGGTTVILPGSGGSVFPSGPFYGLSLRYTRAKCTQVVKVPRSLYIALNRYMYGLMTEEGGTRRGFTPSDEAMIMFYSTIMKQASGCVAGQ
jgi:hypothetical protein